ncbi:Glutamyl-tRNA(Gln) amidotransferase subunit F [Colletotrichum siamense]|uniref:Glutamyl-tRNA(Gln) amidotransferase subunit F n=1 Tax=Colletotrichum siamense TaxID=690259 RepID=UPI001872C4DE|nr:Glutamyl-tRNA(Gln) amidotransferase subunit F [Colletotrichum siamense]KAF5511705.1 Glutamyl-tRNA(Gln) amidotransferase subunit F [Colletotrichum siamense]
MRSLCTRCSAVLRHQRAFTTSAARPSAQKSIQQVLAQPTWSVASLLPKSDDAKSTAEEPITRSKLHHLLRLSALPLPETEAEEAAMLRTLHSQLHFVRDVQSVDTSGVEPLRSLRDETTEGIAEATIGLQQLSEVLGKEVRFGHKKRPKRQRGNKVDTKGVEDWNPLETASRTAGKYFVVQSKKEES